MIHLEPIRTFFYDSVRLDLVRDNHRCLLFLRLTEFVDGYYSGRTIVSNEVTVEFDEDLNLMNPAFDIAVEKLKAIQDRKPTENLNKLLLF